HTQPQLHQMGNSCISGRRRARHLRRRRAQPQADEASRHSSMMLDLSQLSDNRSLPYIISLYDQLEDISFLTDLLGEGGNRLTEQESIRLTVRFIVRHYDRDENETLKKFALFQLHSYSEVERQFLIMVGILIEEVPIDHCLGACIISMILDGGCLPTKELVSDLMQQLDFANASSLSEIKQKNSLCVVAALATKLAGAMFNSLLTVELLQFVHNRLANLTAPPATAASSNTSVIDSELKQYLLDNKPELDVACAALLMLQAFLVTSDDRPGLVLQICSLTSDTEQISLTDCLIRAESWLPMSDSGPLRELASLSLLLLDNYFLPPGRVSSWDAAASQRERLNAMLSAETSTEAMHILPDGLEARSDAASFESVRATFPAKSGKWYYEVTLVTGGIMQIGWASGATVFLSHEGIGVGDDALSLGIDGCRMCIWTNGRPSQLGYNWRRWKPGDTVGCLLDFTSGSAKFSLNGKWSAETHKAFLQQQQRQHAEPQSDLAIYPAASLMSNQQCRFNFGSRPFRYPPPEGVSDTMDSAGQLPADSLARQILPWTAAVRHRRERLMRQDFSGLCHICADLPATTRLKPCGHSGLCVRCPGMLAECPFCRAGIESCELVDGDSGEEGNEAKTGSAMCRCKLADQEV
ncbi:hypothetical protein BOX15_Mlig025293g1, partial [Macrostomum lignano]